MTTYSGDRLEVLRFCDLTTKTVLDVGCGQGGLARHLRAGGADFVYGIEQENGQADVASRKEYDEVFAVTVEEALDGPLQGRDFDLIILADVLEHLVDPWTVAERLTQHLRPAGEVILSVPNVGSIGVLKQLLRYGDWSYTDAGTFDRTHLRWFGRHTIRDLMDRAGLTPVRWGAQLSFRWKSIGIDRLVDDVNHIPSMAIYQHHILARRV